MEEEQSPLFKPHLRTSNYSVILTAFERCFESPASSEHQFWAVLDELDASPWGRPTWLLWQGFASGRTLGGHLSCSENRYCQDTARSQGLRTQVHKSNSQETNILTRSTTYLFAMGNVLYNQNTQVCCIDATSPESRYLGKNFLSEDLNLMELVKDNISSPGR